MRKRIAVTIAIALALLPLWFLFRHSGIGKNGARELELTIDAMQELKTLRMRSNAPHSTGTWEFVCPDRVHFSGEITQRDWEEIDIGKKVFFRDPSGEWELQPSGLTGGAGCSLGWGQIRGKHREMRRNFYFEYVGTDAVGSQKCDSWRIANQEEPKFDVMLICIDPTSHRLLQLKRGSLIEQFYDFDQEIEIAEPQVTATASQSSSSEVPGGPE